MNKSMPDSPQSQIEIFTTPEQLRAEAERLERIALSYRAQADICDLYAMSLEDTARKLRYAAFCAEQNRKD